MKDQTKTYAYTLIIPAGCKGSDDVDTSQFFNGRRYREFSHEEQKQLLTAILNNLSFLNKPADFTINLERHKDDRYHAHGHVCATSNDMLFFQRIVNCTLGYLESNPKIFYFKIARSLEKWEEYCKKDRLIEADLSSVLCDNQFHD